MKHHAQRKTTQCRHAVRTARLWPASGTCAAACQEATAGHAACSPKPADYRLPDHQPSEHCSTHTGHQEQAAPDTQPQSVDAVHCRSSGVSSSWRHGASPDSRGQPAGSAAVHHAQLAVAVASHQLRGEASLQIARRSHRIICAVGRQLRHAGVSLCSLQRMGAAHRQPYRCILTCQFARDPSGA